MLLDLSPAYVFGLVALFPVLLWRLHSYLTHKSYTLKDIPFHRFEENDVPERYITESRALLHDGYQRVRRDRPKLDFSGHIGDIDHLT